MLQEHNTFPYYSFKQAATHCGDGAHSPARITQPFFSGGRCFLLASTEHFLSHNFDSASNFQLYGCSTSKYKSLYISAS